MHIQSFRAGAAAFIIAAAIGVMATGAARAESVMKECGAEWQAAKTNNTTGGQSWQDFLKGCRTRHAGTSAAAPAAAPAPMAAPAPAPVAAPAPVPVQAALPKPAPAVAPKPMAKSTGAGQFASEGEAKARCPSDTVVWVNTKSHIYHYAGTRSYGTTKQGAYMCEADAAASGDRASKSRVGAAAQQ